jgi:hypothetical protein
MAPLSLRNLLQNVSFMMQILLGKMPLIPGVEFVHIPLKNCIEKEVLEGICEYDLDCTIDSILDEQLIE